MSNMSEELATVVAIDGNHAWVECERRSACSGCHQQSSCGTGTVAKAFPMKAQRLRVALTGDVAVGQQIRLGIPQASILRGAALVYVLPLFCLLLGALLGRRKLPPPQAVRKAIEELGLTYIKLGQVLAMQRGLLPEAYIDELALLHDRVPAMDVATVRAIVESELGEPVDSLFLEFSETPLGAASIAQVHDATLWDGRRVAVKVQRPTLAKSSRVTLRR